LWKSSEDSAYALALVGLLIWPLAVVGWIWGNSIKAQSGGVYGARAARSGAAVTVLGIVFVVLIGLVNSA